MEKKKPLKIDAVRVFAVYGASRMFPTAFEAIAYIKDQPNQSSKGTKPLARIEVRVTYKEGGYNEAAFPHKEDAIEFLRNREQGLL